MVEIVIPCNKPSKRLFPNEKVDITIMTNKIYFTMAIP